MGFRESYDFELLINETENLVIEELERQLSKERNDEICKCHDCILDMAALALNSIPAAYRSSLTGIIYAQRLHNGDFKEKVEKSVAMAIKRVGGNPSHEAG
jgi:competence protein ComFB